jgi:hypothetical protein
MAFGARRSELLGVLVPWLAGLAACVWHTLPALACSFASQPDHVLDPLARASDSTAPTAPTVTVVKIQRGKAPDTDFASCSQSATSCDDLGSVDLQIAASDDQAPTDSLGYQLVLTSGQLPSGMTLPTGTVRAMAGHIYLHWTDDATEDQEAVAFSLTLRAVDLAGNAGPSTTMDIRDAGSGDAGCGVGLRRPLSAWPVTTIAILLLARALRASRRRHFE